MGGQNKTMEEQKHLSSNSQLTFGHNLYHQEADSSYERLVSHLVDDDEPEQRVMNEWTKAFIHDGSRSYETCSVEYFRHLQSLLKILCLIWNELNLYRPSFDK